MTAPLLLFGLMLILLLVVSALFSAAETALTRASRGRMHQLEREGDPGAKRVNRLLDDQGEAEDEQRRCHARQMSIQFRPKRLRKQGTL